MVNRIDGYGNPKITGKNRPTTDTSTRTNVDISTRTNVATSTRTNAGTSTRTNAGTSTRTNARIIRKRKRKYHTVYYSNTVWHEKIAELQRRLCMRSIAEVYRYAIQQLLHQK